jgi:hypothetical protein
MRNEHSARRVRSSSDITDGLRRLGIVLACAAGLLLVALASAPGTAVAQAGKRQTVQGHERLERAAGADRGTVLNGALAHTLGRWARAVRPSALPPDEHDIDSERDSDSRPHSNTQGHLSGAACPQPGNPLRRGVEARSSLRSVAFEFSAAPASDHLSRAPPACYAPGRHA